MTSLSQPELQSAPCIRQMLTEHRALPCSRYWEYTSQWGQKTSLVRGAHGGKKDNTHVQSGNSLPRAGSRMESDREATGGRWPMTVFRVSASLISISGSLGKLLEGSVRCALLRSSVDSSVTFPTRNASR